MLPASATTVSPIQDRPAVERPEPQGPDGSDGRFAGLMAQFVQARPDPQPPADQPAPPPSRAEAAGETGSPSGPEALEPPSLPKTDPTEAPRSGRETPLPTDGSPAPSLPGTGIHPPEPLVSAGGGLPGPVPSTATPVTPSQDKPLAGPRIETLGQVPPPPSPPQLPVPAPAEASAGLSGPKAPASAALASIHVPSTSSREGERPGTEPLPAGQPGPRDASRLKGLVQAEGPLSGLVQTPKPVVPGPAAMGDPGPPPAGVAFEPEETPVHPGVDADPPPLEALNLKAGPLPAAQAHPGVLPGAALAAGPRLSQAPPLAAPAPPPPASTAPAPAPAVVQVDGGLRWMLKGGAQEARLQLHPESLGQVTIHLKVEGGEVHARLWITEPASVQAVQEGRPHLEQSLKDHGLQLGSFDLQQGQRPFQEMPSAPPPPAKPDLPAQAARQEAPAPPPPAILSTHHVELYA